MALTKQEREMRARIAGLTTRSRHDPAQMTRPAREAVWERYLDVVDPNGQLPIVERIARAQAARQADMQRLAMRSAVARRKRREAEQAEAKTKRGMP